MKAYVKFIDDLPFIIRVILALPGIDGIVYGLYRIGKGKLIAGLIWIFVGTVITWILDLYSLFTEGKVTFFV
jgi:hypothetical protein